MGIGWLDGLIYCLGLLIIFIPAQSFPGITYRDSKLRVLKHAMGLFLFAVGTMGIHLEIRDQVGTGFILSSIIGLMLMSLVKVWWESRDNTPENGS